MEANSVYLEQYVDSLETLPAELRRNFTLMHDLDTKNKAILQNVDAASDEYLQKVSIKYGYSIYILQQSGY